MTETIIPLRFTACHPDGLPDAESIRHLPDPDTVETECGPEAEWQFGTCVRCKQSIARFRIRRGGRWFDRWGNVPESAYLIGDTA